MILQLDIERLRSLDEVRDFMAGSASVDFRFVESLVPREVSLKCRRQSQEK